MKNKLKSKMVNSDDVGIALLGKPEAYIIRFNVNFREHLMNK